MQSSGLGKSQVSLSSLENANTQGSNPTTTPVIL